MPYLIDQWRKTHPGRELADQQVFTQPWPATAKQRTAGRRDKVIHYQYRADRARRTLRGIDEQIAKAEKAVAGQVPIKRNRFVALSGGDRTVNRELEAKTRALAEIKGYTTNLTDQSAEFVIGAYQPTLARRESLPDVQT